MKLPAVVAVSLLSLVVGLTAQTPQPDAYQRRVSQEDLDELRAAITKGEALRRSVSVVPLDAAKTRVSFGDESNNVWVIESPSVTVAPAATGMTLIAIGGNVIRPKAVEPVPFNRITVSFQGELVRQVTLETPAR